MPVKRKQGFKALLFGWLALNNFYHEWPQLANSTNVLLMRAAGFSGGKVAPPALS